MAKSVNISCRYYQVFALDENGDITNNLYDLRGWINDLLHKTFSEKYKDTNGIKGRLEDLGSVGGGEIYGLNFMRMEDFSSSYILSLNDPATHIDINIDADEYIAKNTVCLYDAENNIIMIQCNRGSYSEKSISSYINEFYDHPVCCILPIFENINFGGDNAEFMKLDIRLANIREFVPIPGTSFEEIIAGVNRVEGVNAHIEISLGNQRNSRLNSGEVRATIANLTNNRGCVSSAKVKMNDDQISGIYELFDNISSDNIKCVVDENGGISFDVLVNRMNDIYIYENARTRVLNAVNNH